MMKEDKIMNETVRMVCPNCKHNYYWYIVEDGNCLKITCKSCNHILRMIERRVKKHENTN